MQTKTYTFHVHGMHCKSCEMLTETEIKADPNVQNAVASLKTRSVDVIGDFGDETVEAVAKRLSLPLQRHGYSLSIQPFDPKVKWREFKIAIPIAAGFVALFLLLQKMGIVNLITTGEVTFGAAFVIGLVASVSTCMAVVGGLVLSMSANYAKGGDAVKPQIFFHLGRLAAFFILGGVIGAIGSAFALGSTGTFILSLLVGLVLLILGINLLDVFPGFKKLQPTLPKFISEGLLRVRGVNHVLTPVIVGIVTFFLPCGFTQSMQIYTLSTGSFMSGALTMFSFALGTLPVLAVLSFTSTKIHSGIRSGTFFKTAGVIVIFFAIFNIINSLAAIGIISPIFNF